MTRDQQKEAGLSENDDVEFVYPLSDATADGMIDMAYRLYQTMMHVFDERRFPLRNTPRDITLDDIAFDRMQRRLTGKDPY